MIVMHAIGDKFNPALVRVADERIRKARTLYKLLGGWYNIQYAKGSDDRLCITRDVKSDTKLPYNIGASIIMGRPVYGTALYINHNLVD